MKETFLIWIILLGIVQCPTMADTPEVVTLSETKKELLKQAYAGDPNSQFELGMLYLIGNQEMKKEYPQAVNWLKKAANRGHVKAQYALGVMYSTGSGVNKDEATHWFTLAAEQGLREAQAELDRLLPVADRGIQKESEFQSMDGYHSAEHRRGKQQQTSPVQTPQAYDQMADSDYNPLAVALQTRRERLKQQQSFNQQQTSHEYNPPAIVTGTSNNTSGKLLAGLFFLLFSGFVVYFIRHLYKEHNKGTNQFESHAKSKKAIVVQPVNMIDNTQFSNTPSTAKLQPYAGFWRRVFAYLIDLALLDTVHAVLSVLILGSAANLLPESALWIFFVSFSFFQFFLLNWLYFAFMESSRYQATIGKQFLGIIVQDLVGYRPSFWRATGRYFAPMILSIPYFIAILLPMASIELYFVSTMLYLLLVAGGGLLIAFTSRKQAFHDIITRCVVVCDQSETGKLHNLSAWFTALAITAIFATSCTLTILNNNDFHQDRPEIQRFIIAFIISLIFSCPLSLLIFFVKRIRNRSLKRNK